MRKTLLALTMLSLQTHAADHFDKKYELQLMPNFGYSNFDGFMFGLEAGFAIPLSERWQWKFGGAYEARKRSSWKAATTGAVYNFDDDWTRAFYLGAGVGLANEQRIDDLNAGRDETKIYGYAEFGKRFVLNKAGTITWSPHVSVESNALDRGHVTLAPASFGFHF